MDAFARYKHVIAAALILAFSVALYVGSQSIRILQPNSTSYINSRFFPDIISIVMGIVSLCELLASIRILSRSESGATGIPAAGVVRIVATLALLAVYVFFLNDVGFWIMTTIYLFVQALLLTPASRRSVLFAGGLAVVASTSIYVFFSHVLTLVLPRGPLPF